MSEKLTASVRFRFIIVRAVTLGYRLLFSRAVFTSSVVSKICFNVRYQCIVLTAGLNLVEAVVYYKNVYIHT